MIDFGFAQEGLDAPPGILGPHGLNRGRGSASPGPSSFQQYADVRGNTRLHSEARPQNLSVPRAERAAQRPSSSSQDASRVTPTPQMERSSSRKRARHLRYSLKNVAARLLPKERVSKCGHSLIASNATVCLGDNGAYIAGVETCGSIWVCPVCAAKIAEGRRKEVAQCLDAHVRAGGEVYMGLFTIPHQSLESCESLKHFVARSWQKLLAGEPWLRAKRRFRIVGYIRALEITFGNNGWHPHIHALFLTQHLSDDERACFKFWLGKRWATVVERITGKQVNLAVGYNLQKACAVSLAGDYVAKWGVDSEISKAHLKTSKKGGRSPWQLLVNAGNGDKAAEIAFREYARVMKGARHLTWSRNLRSLYIITPELSDDELAKSEMPYNGDRILGTIHRSTWNILCKKQLLPVLLYAAETDGWIGVDRLLRSHHFL